MGPLEISDKLVKSYYEKNEIGVLETIYCDEEMTTLKKQNSKTMQKIQNVIMKQCIDYGHHYAKVAYVEGLKEGIRMAMTIRNICIEIQPQK